MIMSFRLCLLFGYVAKFSNSHVALRVSLAGCYDNLDIIDVRKIIHDIHLRHSHPFVQKGCSGLENEYSGWFFAMSTRVFSRVPSQVPRNPPLENAN